mmetsp:Transcript_3365/g.7948  ORF Transcript_3365/g.7948 Transcript_3365/m.7948 type:complete len:280 (+) Transcript_3365:2272-3111(+)
MRAASSFEVFAGSKAKSVFTASGSSAGCSASPALTSSASASFATFCSPAPMAPERHFVIESLSSWAMVFCILGEPPEVFQTLLATRFTAASGSLRATKARIRIRSRISFDEHSSQVKRSWPNFLCSRIFSAVFRRSCMDFSRTIWNFFQSPDPRAAAYAPSKAEISSSGHRSPKRPTRAWAALRAGSSVMSFSPVTPMSIAGNKRSMKGTKSIFMACGIVSMSSRNPRRTANLSSLAPFCTSGMSCESLAFSMRTKTSARPRDAPICSEASPARSLLKR